MGVSGVLAALDGHGDEVGQAVALLAAAGIDDPESLSLGDGDRRLLALCRDLTGGDLEVVAVCPGCGELSEALLSPGAVPPARPRTSLIGSGGGLREPTYNDLRDLPSDPDQAVHELLGRCVVGSPSRAPRPGDMDGVDDSLAGPIGIACSGCGQPIAVDVDVEKAVLERLARRAREIDIEVHLLASAYHWSLGEIESLGDERRGALARLVADA